MILEGKNLNAGYGALQILHDCSIAVNSGELAVIVGPNGAGKSTAMKALLGLITPTSGTVTMHEKNIINLSVQERIKQGMAFVPQTHNVFPSMSVLENLQMGGFLRTDDINSTITQIFDIFPVLGEKQHQVVGELSGGQRQQVAFGRALMTNPQVLLLDEPTAGVSPIVMQEIFKSILTLKERGIAILMVEQNARQALEIADTGFVLVMGANKFSGRGADLLADKEVRRAFLGG